MANPSHTIDEHRDRLCALLNVAYDLGAEAEVIAGAYTGRLVLSEAQTARLLEERAALAVLVARVEELSRLLGEPPDLPGALRARSRPIVVVGVRHATA